MRDRYIRPAVHEIILKDAHEDKSSFVINELGLKNGEYRADIAVFNGKMIGYEIKAENDTLCRLEAQVKAYNALFDKIFIITCEKHLAGVLKIIPAWWGIYLTSENKANYSYQFENYRSAKINKKKDPFAIAQLLWKDEAIEVVNTLYSEKVKTSFSRHELYEILSNKLSSKKLSAIVTERLKTRANWRIDHAPLS